MGYITLTILGVGDNFKVAVYNDNKTYKVYAYPKFHNIPVYAGQKIKFIYNENRSWTYDDRNHKTYYFDHGTTHIVTVPLTAQGNATLFVTDRYSDWFLSLHGGLGWIDEALVLNNKRRKITDEKCVGNT